MKAQTEANPAPPEEESRASGMMKSSLGLLPFPRPSIPAGLQRLIKSFRSLSQLFAVYKEEDDEKMDMEIGCPTDVQHVCHIGLDGTPSVGTMKSWGRAPEIPSPHSLSPEQFELAMAAQANHTPPSDSLSCPST